jgi:hypothetical protein
MGSGNLKADFEISTSDSAHGVKSGLESTESLIFFAATSVKGFVAVNTLRWHPLQFVLRDAKSRVTFHADHMDLHYIFQIEQPAIVGGHFFFPAFFETLAVFLMCLTTLGWNKCFINSSLVISFGCFFFFMVTR